MNNISHKGYELVVSKSSFRNLFNGECKELGYSLFTVSLETLSKSFIEFVEAKIESSPFTYEGFDLVIEPYGFTAFWGECKELKYSDSAKTIGLLKSRFRKFVNDRQKDDEVKDRFLITIDNHVLEVTNFGGHRPWRGSCKEIDFEWEGFIFLEDLLSKFRKKTEEQPVKIQYNGYELEVIRKDQDNAWFIGTSDLSLDWKMESATIYLIETAWKKEVDERVKLLGKVKDYQQKILDQQLELEAVLEKEGYIIRAVGEKELSARYAIHPDYYSQWRYDETNLDFPEFAVIQIW